MIAEKNKFISAVFSLFKTFEEIKIFPNKYSDESIKILKHFGKKSRTNDMRNQKCLFKLWSDTTVSTVFVYLRS